MHSATFSDFDVRIDTARAISGTAGYLGVGLRPIVLPFVLFPYLSRLLRQIVSDLDRDLEGFLGSSNSEIAVEKLHEIHRHLIPLAKLASQNFFWRKTLASILRSTEDLGDILENISLARDARLRSIVERSIQAATSELHSTA